MKSQGWALWVAQVKHPTLDFSSGHNVTVCGVEPLSMLSMESAWDSLFLPCSCPLKIN